MEDCRQATAHAQYPIKGTAHKREKTLVVPNVGTTQILAAEYYRHSHQGYARNYIEYDLGPIAKQLQLLKHLHLISLQTCPYFQKWERRSSTLKLTGLVYSIATSS